jgi:hypothetical protein
MDIPRNVLEGLERDFLLNRVYVILRKSCGYMVLLCMSRKSSTQDVYNELHDLWPEYETNRLIFTNRNNDKLYLPNLKHLSFYDWCIQNKLPSCTNKDIKMTYMCTIENSNHSHNLSNNEIN